MSCPLNSQPDRRSDTTERRHRDSDHTHRGTRTRHTTRHTPVARSLSTDVGLPKRRATAYIQSGNQGVRHSCAVDNGDEAPEVTEAEVDAEARMGGSVGAGDGGRAGAGSSAKPGSADSGERSDGADEVMGDAAMKRPL